ncbi:biopolymer transporter ExbD [Qingshengfaniella alkalisoli]|uniref:Biopolymer transporter ExbD n=2 Tax=Qingshengfaniella alkalisoli TaxID=2599296 RepID=A0A5B8IAB6_9RHOB|nr:biopolymer transporter ExbD [Qingshengfaniella alkalisoli]QDY70176.1 biopolymer transporter ExbD [Qingshengfaniella alkalisoli]
MTSLIDVIFLLLLFFMLTSTFTKFGEIELSVANTGTSATEGQPVFLRLSVEGTTLNGQVVVPERLPDSLQDAGSVLIGLSDDVTAQRLVDVLAVVRAVPDLSYRVLQ